MTRWAKIRREPRCGWPDECQLKTIDHAPAPGPYLDGYPECSLINLHDGEHDYRRHAAEPEPEAGL